jgi:hypothetical protein
MKYRPAWSRAPTRSSNESFALRHLMVANVRFGSLGAAPIATAVSALPPKADTEAEARRVRFGPQADSRTAACS